MSVERPSLTVAVIMRRVRVQGAHTRWQPWRWVLHAVHEVDAHDASLGTAPRLLQDTGDEQQWLFPHYKVELFRDEAEGYLLNLTSSAPCWFVLWRLEDEHKLNDEYCVAVPETVTLSYHEAGRWLDAQETVEQVGAPAHVVAWLREFADAHYVPEEKKRKRPESFKSLQDRFGNPASVSVGEKRKMSGGRP